MQRYLVHKTANALNRPRADLRLAKRDITCWTIMCPQFVARSTLAAAKTPDMDTQDKPHLEPLHP